MNSLLQVQAKAFLLFPVESDILFSVIISLKNA